MSETSWANTGYLICLLGSDAEKEIYSLQICEDFHVINTMQLFDIA